MVAGWLGTRSPRHDDRGAVLGRPAPDPALPALMRAALTVPDDLVVMRRTEAGWVLAAAALHFPSAWRLSEKIGRPLHAVHEPVPGYAEGTRNAALIERMLDRLPPGTIVARGNWSLHAEGALHLPVCRARPRRSRPRRPASPLLPPARGAPDPAPPAGRRHPLHHRRDGARGPRDRAPRGPRHGPAAPRARCRPARLQGPDGQRRGDRGTTGSSPARSLKARPGTRRRRTGEASSIREAPDAGDAEHRRGSATMSGGGSGLARAPGTTSMVRTSARRRPRHPMAVHVPQASLPARARSGHVGYGRADKAGR